MCYTAPIAVYFPFAAQLETIIVRLALTLALCCLSPVIGAISLDLGLYVVRLFVWNSTETYGIIKRRLSQPSISTLDQARKSTSSASISTPQNRLSWFFSDDSADNADAEYEDGGESDMNMDEDDPIYTLRKPSNNSHASRRSRHNSIIKDQAAMVSKRIPSSTHLGDRRSSNTSSTSLRRNSSSNSGLMKMSNYTYTSSSSARYHNTAAASRPRATFSFAAPAPAVPEHHSKGRPGPKAVAT